MKLERNEQAESTEREGGCGGGGGETLGHWGPVLGLWLFPQATAEICTEKYNGWMWLLY